MIFIFFILQIPENFGKIKKEKNTKVIVLGRCCYLNSYIKSTKQNFKLTGFSVNIK